MGTASGNKKNEKEDLVFYDYPEFRKYRALKT
jgi:hypothetical protein